MDWEKIWREHGVEIYNYIYYRVYNRQEAEDMTQDAFLKLIRVEKRYQNRDTSAIVALLKTTARNLIVDNWRRKNTASKHIYIEIGEQEVCLQKGVEEIVEERDEVVRALKLLNKDQQKIIKYRLLDGFSIAETAELMGKSISAIKTTQYRSVQLLRHTLTKQESKEKRSEAREKVIPFCS